MANIVDGQGGSRCLWKQPKVEARAWRINGTSQRTSKNLQQCWESRRSQLFFSCSRTIPAESVRRVRLSPHILALKTGASSAFLPSMHHEIQGLQGERCRHLLKRNQKMQVKYGWLENLGVFAFSILFSGFFCIRETRLLTCKKPLN